MRPNPAKHNANTHYENSLISISSCCITVTWLEFGKYIEAKDVPNILIAA